MCVLFVLWNKRHTELKREEKVPVLFSPTSTWAMRAGAIHLPNTRGHTVQWTVTGGATWALRVQSAHQHYSGVTHSYLTITPFRNRWQVHDYDTSQLVPSTSWKTDVPHLKIRWSKNICSKKEEKCNLSESPCLTTSSTPLHPYLLQYPPHIHLTYSAIAEILEQQ